MPLLSHRRYVLRIVGENHHRCVFEAELVTPAEDTWFRSLAFLQVWRVHFSWLGRLLLQGHQFAFIEIDPWCRGAQSIWPRAWPSVMFSQ